MSIEERRDLALAHAGTEVRADGEGGAERLYGLAAPYNVRTPIGNPRTWGWFEEFMPGAFAESIANDDQRKLIDHNPYYVVSRRSAGTLVYTETGRGLEYDSALDDALSYVGDLIANVRNKNITGESVGFSVLPDGAIWSLIEVEEPRADGKVEVYTAELRQVFKATLWESSSVTWPAYTDTDAQLRRYALGPALIARGDRQAISRRAEHRPDLGELLKLLDDRQATPTPATRSLEDAQRVMRMHQRRFPHLV
jgi:HK97 family phage prohead protease